MVKKNPFTTSIQEKNTLQEADVSLSKSRGFTTRCKQGQIRLGQKTSKKSQTISGNVFFGWLKLRSTCTRMKGRKKYGEGLEQLMIQSIKHHLWNLVDQCDGMSMASSGTGLLVFIDDLTEDRSSRKNSEMYRDILSAQIQSNAAKLIGRRFMVQMDDDPKHTAKATQEFLKVKKKNYILQWPSQSPDLNLIEHAFHLRKTKLKTTEVSCSKGLAKHNKGGNPVSGDVHEFQT